MRHGRRTEYGHNNDTVRLRSVTNTDCNSEQSVRHKHHAERNDEPVIAIAELWDHPAAIDHEFAFHDRHHHWHNVDDRPDYRQQHHDLAVYIEHAAVDDQSTRSNQPVDGFARHDIDAAEHDASSAGYDRAACRSEQYGAVVFAACDHE